MCCEDSLSARHVERAMSLPASAASLRAIVALLVQTYEELARAAGLLDRSC